jgi:hypothetical protein
MAMVISVYTLVSVLLESTFSRIRLLRASVEGWRNMMGSNATLLLGGQMYARGGALTNPSCPSYREGARGAHLSERRLTEKRDVRAPIHTS